MRSLFAAAALGLVLVLPGSASAQVDTRRVIRSPEVTRAIQANTTAVVFTRPVSRAVLEAARAIADTQRQVTAQAIRRPAWSSQAVLRQRLVRQQAADPAVRLFVRARPLPRPAGPAPTPAEDTTLRNQRAGDFRFRADAIARIEATPVRRLNPAIAVNLINELDSVASARLSTTPKDSADAPDEQEQYPEYVISLTRAVVRLKNPTSVRALALGGLGTSRDAQRFVASQGTAGLGVLDTAFAASDAVAPAVVNTWGYTLADDPSRLPFDDSVHVYARILLSAQYYPVAFTYAARHARLFELIPELDSIAAQATADTKPALAGAARSASRVLDSAFAAAQPRDWLARLRLRTGVQCIDEALLGPAACTQLIAATGAAAAGLGNLDVVRQAMTQYRGLADAAAGDGRMSAATRASLQRLVDGLLHASGDAQTPAPTAHQ